MNDGIKITLKAARVNAGFTQPEVAKALHVNIGSIVNWEKDASKIKMERANELANMYHMPVNALFFGKTSEFISALRRN